MPGTLHGSHVLSGVFLCTKVGTTCARHAVDITLSNSWRWLAAVTPCPSANGSAPRWLASLRNTVVNCMHKCWRHACTHCTMTLSHIAKAGSVQLGSGSNASVRNTHSEWPSHAAATTAVALGPSHWWAANAPHTPTAKANHCRTALVTTNVPQQRTCGAPVAGEENARNSPRCRGACNQQPVLNRGTGHGRSSAHSKRPHRRASRDGGGLGRGATPGIGRRRRRAHHRGGHAGHNRVHAARQVREEAGIAHVTWHCGGVLLQREPVFTRGDSRRQRHAWCS